MTTKQPPDEWDFLPTEEIDEEPATPAPEVAAVHVDQHHRRPRDPGRSEVEVERAPDSEAPRSYFADEEPEERIVAPASEEPEPDLQDVLASQHYAFDEGDDEAEGETEVGETGS